MTRGRHTWVALQSVRDEMEAHLGAYLTEVEQAVLGTWTITDDGLGGTIAVTIDGVTYSESSLADLSAAIDAVAGYTASVEGSDITVTGPGSMTAVTGCTVSVTTTDTLPAPSEYLVTQDAAEDVARHPERGVLVVSVEGSVDEVDYVSPHRDSTIPLLVSYYHQDDSHDPETSDQISWLCARAIGECLDREVEYQGAGIHYIDITESSSIQIGSRWARAAQVRATVLQRTTRGGT